MNDKDTKADIDDIDNRLARTNTLLADIAKSLAELVNAQRREDKAQSKKT